MIRREGVERISWREEADLWVRSEHSVHNLLACYSCSGSPQSEKENPELSPNLQLLSVCGRVVTLT